MEHWYRVTVFEGGVLVAKLSKGYRTFTEAGAACDKLKKAKPKADVQLWVRER